MCHLAQWGAGPHVGFLRAVIMKAVVIITKGYRRVMGLERPWQCKLMFSTDKPLGDTYAVIQMTFNDSFTFWTQICQGLADPLSQTALCDLPSALHAALPYQCGSCLHPGRDHSVPKRALLPSQELL